MMKSEMTKCRILRCAYEMINAIDYDSVKITDICSAAHVSATTFYSYFPTKDLLISEYYKQNVVFNQEDFSLILSQSNEWLQLITAHNMYSAKMSIIGKKYCSQLLKLPKSTKVINEDNRCILEPLIRQAKEKGYVRNSSSSDALYSVSCQLMRGVYYTWSFSETEYKLETEVRRVLEVFYDIPAELRLNS